MVQVKLTGRARTGPVRTAHFARMRVTTLLRISIALNVIAEDLVRRIQTKLVALFDEQWHAMAKF